MSESTPIVEFIRSAQALAGWSSTPGWEDNDGNKTTPGAKPIGFAQWKDALRVAALIEKHMPSAGWPTPGVDPDGSIWLTWGDDVRNLALRLNSSLVASCVEWRTMVDGTIGKHSGSSLQAVFESLRSTIRTPLVLLRV